MNENDNASEIKNELRVPNYRCHLIVVFELDFYFTSSKMANNTNEPVIG